MKSVLDSLNDKEKWISFLSFLEDRKQFKTKEINAIKDIIYSNSFKEMNLQWLFNLIDATTLEYCEIPKHNSNKNRIVFKTTGILDILLKFITFLLRDYDNLFSESLYSYRNTVSVKKAIYKLNDFVLTNNYQIFKFDISSYFLSMNKEILISKIEKLFMCDKEFVNFNIKLLNMKNNKNIKSGGLPGLAISSFYAKIYLNDLDLLLSKKYSLYIRYSDDILICNKSEIDIKEITDCLKSLKLELNTEKTEIIKDNSNFDYLGFTFKNKQIDLSELAFKKIKHKIKRSSNKIKYKISHNDFDKDNGLKYFIDIYNKKFFSSSFGEICWALWYFPIITTDKTLKMIDAYFQNECRSIITGKYNKMNIKKVPYSFLKEKGYRTLVNEYYLNKDLKNPLIPDSF